MTVENEMYAGGWVKCARCTVSDAIARKALDKALNTYVCIDIAECDRWIAELKSSHLVPARRPLKVGEVDQLAGKFINERRFKTVEVTVPAPQVKASK